ncbi:hypothetical protein MSG28_016225 [Choristoneura fumiferana]|uniref:Uncharacterized protein n=1 Tax=Choristoneura fumiferana TaxID=7141 RepID=A0ACC0K5S7_CHOFU|nr:hypothetical protein MSG28_016225 [Choristoneura fumiferana]
MVVAIRADLAQEKWGVIIPTNQSGSSSERESDSSGTTSDSDEGFRVEIPTNQTEESPSERDSDSSAATSDSDANPIKPPVIDKTITRVKSAVGFPTAFDCKAFATRPGLHGAGGRLLNNSMSSSTRVSCIGCYVHPRPQACARAVHPHQVIAGDPRVTIQWMFQKEQANDRIKDLHHNRTPYMITSVQPEDAGFYICHAENGGGTDSHRIKLFVTDFMNKPVPGRGNATDAFESPIQRGDPPNCLLAKNPPNSNKPARKND